MTKKSQIIKGMTRMTYEVLRKEVAFIINGLCVFPPIPNGRNMKLCIRIFNLADQAGFSRDLLVS